MLLSVGSNDFDLLLPKQTSPRNNGFVHIYKSRATSFPLLAISNVIPGHSLILPRVKNNCLMCDVCAMVSAQSNSFCALNFQRDDVNMQERHEFALSARLSELMTKN